MEYFAVIDTETTWDNRVMSIGTIVADSGNFQMVDARYHVLTPEYQAGGMFSSVLFSDSRLKPSICSRQEAMEELKDFLSGYDVQRMFAYNAGFDRNHLPELGHLQWYDIMRMAAYRQHNPQIPRHAPCFSTGRLKRGYGVESMLRMLSCDQCYCETHNALYDAMDELRIMSLLGHSIQNYIPL